MGATTQEQQPRTSDTGVLNTEAGIKARVDWLAWTVQGQSWPEIQARLFPGEWVKRARGGFGYGRAWQARNLVAFTDPPAGREDMGIHLSASGQAVAALEAAFGDIVDWWAETWAATAKLTRLDVAWDDQAATPDAGALDLETMRQELEAGAVAMRWRTWQAVATWKSHETFRQTGEGPKRAGMTLYFGRRGSDSFCRIYDKREEQLAKLAAKSPDRSALPGHWIRVELEMRHEAANALFGVIKDAGWVGATEILRGYLDFRIPSEDSNRARWRVAPWWDKFLQGASKAALGLSKKLEQAERTVAWLKRQVAVALARAVDAGGNWVWVQELVAEGRKRDHDPGQRISELAAWFAARGYGSVATG